MTWRDLIEEQAHGYHVFPWLGGPKVHRKGRTWYIKGRRPREHGWYLFEVTGRTAKLCERAAKPSDFAEGKTVTQGLLVGDRFVPSKARVDPDPGKLIEQTTPVSLVEPGLDHFVPVLVVMENGYESAIFDTALFDTQATVAVRTAYLDRRPDVADIKDVPPALDLAFRFSTRQRALVEHARAEVERLHKEEEHRAEILRTTGTGAGRRELARTDFEEAARAALRVAGAELIDVRPAYGTNEMAVRYRIEERRLECTCDRYTLRVIDAGVCLQDHRTGEKGDTRFTLESLPGVVREAIREHKLVVWRHVDGDQPGYDEHDDDHDWDD